MKIIGASLPSITDTYGTRCICKATIIVEDPMHPSHRLLTLLPSGKRFWSIQTLTARLQNSIFPQTAEYSVTGLTHTRHYQALICTVSYTYTCTPSYMKLLFAHCSVFLNNPLSLLHFYVDTVLCLYHFVLSTVVVFCVQFLHITIYVVLC